MKNTIALHNLGCKVNAYELERMAEKLKAAGYEIVPFDSRADFYLVNTCTVTNIADRKSRQMLHRAKSLNPGAAVIAAGCYVDSRGREALASEGIDILISNREKDQLTEILGAWKREHPEQKEEKKAQIEEKEEQEEKRAQIEEKEEQKAETDDSAEPEGISMQASIPADSPMSENDSAAESSPDPAAVSLHTPAEGGYSRAFLKVQDGCNMFCTYCIIPYARGRITSKRTDEVLEEVRRLGASGYREFILTGIHLSSYGMDRREDQESLLSLIEALAQVPEVKRLRLGSLEPRIITEDFVKALTRVKSLCPHFHLSLQSGSDTVLKRMNRHYTAEEFRKGTELLRQYFSDPALTTDVIVGFPGETEEEFRETEAFLKEIRFYETHIFPYSRRKGTPADTMPGQLSRAEKHRRLTILKDLDTGNRAAYEDLWSNGREAEVLFETPEEGYTREYIRVKDPEGGHIPGEILRGRLTGRSPEGLPVFTASEA